MSKWAAVVYDEDGFVIDPRDLDEILAGGEEAQEEHGQDITEVVVVSGTAIPVPQSAHPDEQFFRAPGSYRTLDKAFSEDLEDVPWGEIKTIIRRAEIFAAALNQEDA